MMKSNFETLRRRKASNEDRKLILKTIAEETGLSLGAVHRVSTGQIEKIHLSTLDTLCGYFNVQSISELVEYVPDNSES
ncbi:MAG TPA: helix-turn-helix domain-containing protein [Abditibacteriaceae bacterium]|jgi:DNA-binding Xre family transcriptional regulator